MACYMDTFTFLKCYESMFLNKLSELKALKYSATSFDSHVGG
jgi:hypothetical protein